MSLGQELAVVGGRVDVKSYREEAALDSSERCWVSAVGTRYHSRVSLKEDVERCATGVVTAGAEVGASLRVIGLDLGKAKVGV